MRIDSMIRNAVRIAFALGLAAIAYASFAQIGQTPLAMRLDSVQALRLLMARRRSQLTTGAALCT